MDIFHLKLFYGYWRIVRFLLHSDQFLSSSSYFPFKNIVSSLCSSSNVYLCIHTYEFKITILLKCFLKWQCFKEYVHMSLHKTQRSFFVLCGLEDSVILEYSTMESKAFFHKSREDEMQGQRLFWKQTVGLSFVKQIQGWGNWPLFDL